MSYEKKRIEYLKDIKNWSELETSYDESWLKIRNLVNSYNTSLKIGVIDYLDNLHKDDFLFDDLVYGEYEDYTKQKLDREYFKTVPKTIPDLLKYIFEYQRIVTAIHSDMETYIMDNGFLIQAPQKEEEENILLIENSTDTKKKFTIPDKSTKENFKEIKDFRRIYDKARRSYRPKLFYLYLDALIKSAGDKYPEILEHVPYSKTGVERKSKTDNKRGRQDFMTMYDGLFILINKARYRNMNTNEYAYLSVEQLSHDKLIGKNYSDSAINNFIRTSDSLEILEYLLEQSAIDIIPYEDTFAIDGTGFSSNTKNDYNSDKHNDGKKETEWVNFQILVPVKSVLVSTSRLYYKYESSENAGIIPIVKHALELGYNINTLTADKLYSGKDLRAELRELGVENYYCEFKDNVIQPKDDDYSQWAIEYRYWKEKEEAFYKEYHKRSNVESVNGAIKTLSGEKLTRKTVDGFFKEVLAKAIRYNIGQMIVQLFLNGIVPHYLKKSDILREIEES